MNDKHPHNFRDLRLEGERPEGGPIAGILAALGILGAIAAIVAAALLLLCGCAATPPHPATPALTNAVLRILERLAAPAAEDPLTVGAEGTPAGVHASVAGSLVFAFGGFRGEGAAEDPATQIGSGRFTSRGMSYTWTAGDLGNWGLGRSEAGALACAFYWDGSAWRGGKFDWISTSRTTRSWENVRAGYGGWDADAFFAAKRRAFCIVSADGRKRTNLEELK
ncbi:MAG: hypothetical protein IJV65_09040 [Kiritimatiellae bacterium]|nr:hypothetical protein [Kiritimatiellia bacterium]